MFKVTFAIHQQVSASEPSAPVVLPASASQPVAEPRSHGVEVREIERMIKDSEDRLQTYTERLVRETAEELRYFTYN